MSETNDITVDETAVEPPASALQLLCTQEPPRLRSSITPWLLGAPLVLLAALSAIAYFNMLDSPKILSATLLLVAVIFALIWQTSTSWDQDIQDTIFLVQECRLELTALKDELLQYLQRVDRRVNGQFTSTSQNAAVYFNLIQIKNAVEERLSIASHLLVNATTPALLSSYECLRQPLQITSSDTTPGSQQGRDISIADVEQTVMELVQQLEATLAGIDDSEPAAVTDESVPSQ